MAAPDETNANTRRAAMARKRQSRRPSRLGFPAGATAKPDYPLADDAGFPGLLNRTWRRAVTAPDLPSMVEILLTLDGHVPADVQLRALRTEDEVALRVLHGLTWREQGATAPPAGGGPLGFLGEMGLTTGGRLILRTPSEAPLASRHALVESSIRVPWPAAAVAAFQRDIERALARRAQAVADCRRWLAATGEEGRDELLGQLTEAARRTAPFILYQEDRQYTNFRDRNTMTGKTLWPGHPDCALSSLRNLPLPLWSDHDVVVVVCLALLVHSAGYARIEEANGTQLSVDHVASLLEETRLRYNQVCGREQVSPASAPTSVSELYALAGALRARRQELRDSVRLYREIHGPLMHKVERIAGPRQEPAQRREAAICDHLRQVLPVTGATLDEIGAGLVAAPGWLARPHGGFGTGLESLVYQTVRAATGAFEADFAMSRGTRSLSKLIRAIRDEDWAEITRWELSEYFCCVVPAAAARRLFGTTRGHLADISWAISSRMQYNSWHFIAGNLPQVPVVVARDYFVPPTSPDIAHYSDQHHRGHVAARVRFSIRSPQAVDILGRTFQGFVDLRLLRCVGRPFEEQDLLAADRGSGLIARATGLAAGLVAAGEEIEVTSFDSQWHWQAAASLATGPPEHP